MQKKLLACLLVAPVAGNAMANFNINQDTYPADKAQSVSGVDQGFKFNFNSGEGLVAPIGAGVVKFQTIKLGSGEYHLYVTGADNLQVTVLGKTYTVNDEIDIPLNITGTTDVTVEMSAIDPLKGFGCKSTSIEVVFDDTYAQKLQALLEEKVPDGITALLAGVTDAALKAEYQNLTTKYNGIVSNIEKISNNITIELYNELQLWEAPAQCIVGKDIAALEVPVKEFNKKAEDANKAAEAAAANKAAIDHLNGLTTDWQDKLDAIMADAAKADEAIKNEADKGVISAQLKDSKEAIQKNIDAINAAIKEQGPKLTAATDFKYPGDLSEESMDAALASLQNALEAAKASYAEWLKYVPELDPLTQTYNQYYTLINSEADVWDGPDAFGTARTNLLSELTALYNANNNSNGAIKPQTPAAEIAAAITAIGEAKEKMKSMYDGFAAMVKAQNDAYTAAAKVADEYQKDLKAATTNADGTPVVAPDSQTANFEALKKAAEDALKAFNDYISQTYQENKLPGTDYASKAKAVEDAIAAINEAKKNFASFDELQLGLVNAEKAIKDISDALNKENKSGFEMDLYGKFTGQIQGLRDAISAIVPGSTTQKDEVEVVQKAMDSMVKTAYDLKVAYLKAANKYIEFNDAIEEYKTDFIPKKLIIKGVDYVANDVNTGLADNKDKKGLNSLLADYAAQLTSIGTLEAQLSYDAATALVKQIETEDPMEQLAAAKAAFAEGATKANEAYAEKVVKDTEAVFEANKTVGDIAANAKIEELKGDLQDAKDKVATALTGGVDVAGLGSADVDLQAVVNTSVALAGGIKDYVDIYNKLTDMDPDIPTLIEEAYDYNNGKDEDGKDNTIDPAKSHFNKDLNPTNGGFITRYNNLLSDLNKGLADGSLHNGAAAFTAKAEALAKEVTDVLEQIKTNQAAYNELLGVSQNVLNSINRVIDNIEANCGDATAKENYLKTLNSLKTVDLAGVDVAVAGDFGNGALNEANKNEYITKYNAIIAAANAVNTQFVGDVADLNKATAGAWDQGIANLRTIKDEAVKVYNTYFYDIKNKGYRAYIDNENPELLVHSPLYSYTQKITQLQDDIQAYIDKCNAEKKAFSETDFAKVATTPMEIMEGDINTDLGNLINEMNRLGGAYWDVQSVDRGGNYTFLVSAMTAAGMFKTDKDGKIVVTEDGTPVLNNNLAGKCDLLETALASYNQAIAKHNTVQVPTTEKPNLDPKDYAKQIGYVMDALANLLDKVDYNEVALEAAAKLQWNALYNTFTEFADDALTSVDSDYPFAKEAERDAAKAAISEQKELAEGYNEQATAEDTNVLSLLQDGGTAALADCTDKVKEALENLKKQNEFGEDSSEVYKDYTGDGGIIPNLDNDLDKLIAYSASLAADSKKEAVDAVADAKDAVDALTKFVEENKADLAADQPNTRAEQLAKDAKDAIAAAYPEVRNAEVALLNSIMVQVREAFNNAKAETEWSDKNAGEWEKKINDAIAAIADLNNLTAEDPENKFQPAAQALEGTLCDYLAELEKVYTHEGTNTSAVDASARLDALYQDVLDALNAAKDALAASEPSVQTEFAGAYGESESELEAIANGYKNAGNKVVALEGNYAADLNAVAKAIAAKKAEIEAANQKALAQKAIDDNAAAIQKNLADLTQQLEEIRSFLSTYQLDSEDQLGLDIKNIENMIAQKETVLNEMIEEKTFTATTEIPTEDIEMALVKLNYNGHIEAVDYVNNLALSAVREARYNLRRAHLLDETRTELTNKLTDANQLRLNAVQTMSDAIDAYETSERTEEDLNAFYETYEQVITDLTKAENDARAVSEGVYDNEFTPGDVDLEPDGAVTVADVQQVITWVGEGVTYEDLLNGANPRQAYAADVNNDQTINIADAVAILNIALQDLEGRSAAPRMLAKGLQAAADNNIGLALNGTEDGIREYAVMINNTTEFVAGQLDLKIGSGMEILDIELTGRAVDHELFRFDNSTGARVVIASMSNAALEGNDGAMLIVRTRGAGNLEVEGAIFADSNATGYTLGSNGLSGIDGINESYQNVKERIYNVAGQTMDRIQRGINIIRKSNGKTTKEMHK